MITVDELWCHNDSNYCKSVTVKTPTWHMVQEIVVLTNNYYPYNTIFNLNYYYLKMALCFKFIFSLLGKSSLVTNEVERYVVT